LLTHHSDLRALCALRSEWLAAEKIEAEPGEWRGVAGRSANSGVNNGSGRALRPRLSHLKQDLTPAKTYCHVKAMVPTWRPELSGVGTGHGTDHMEIPRV
jgi:hypothetical protein